MPPFYIEPADAEDGEMADIDQAVTFRRTMMALPSRAMRQHLEIIPAIPMLYAMHHLFTAVWGQAPVLPFMYVLPFKYIRTKKESVSEKGPLLFGMIIHKIKRQSRIIPFLTRPPVRTTMKSGR